MNSKYVYISSCCNDGGIHIFKLKNNLLCKESFFECDSPMYSIYAKDRLWILLRAPFADNDNSGIFKCSVSKDGHLTKESEIFSTEGVVGCHLCCDEGEIYAANYVSGSITKLGKKLVIHEGNSVHPTRQEKAHTHFVCISPDGKYIITVDLGMDAIIIYDKDLNEISRVNAPLGNGPRHLAFSDNGRLCYCADELSSTVSVYSYNNGKLTYLSSHSSLPKSFKGKSTIAAIRQNNGYVYTSNRGHDSIAVFKAGNEGLSLVNIFSCGGNGPRDFDIADNTLISANEVDGSVTIFDISDIQKPELKQKIHVKNALCVTIV